MLDLRSLQELGLLFPGLRGNMWMLVRCSHNPTVGPVITSPILQVAKSRLRVKPPSQDHLGKSRGIAMPSPEQSLVNRCHGLQRGEVGVGGGLHPTFAPATTREASSLEGHTVQQRSQGGKGKGHTGGVEPPDRMDICLVLRWGHQSVPKGTAVSSEGAGERPYPSTLLQSSPGPA